MVPNMLGYYRQARSLGANAATVNEIVRKTNGLGYRLYGDTGIKHNCLLDSCLA